MAHGRSRAVTKPLEPKVVLELFGAAAGIAAFVTFVGGALLWLRFDELGLPADQAISLLPRTALITAGAHALIVPAIIGLGAVVLLYALGSWSQLVVDALAFVLFFVAALAVQDVLFDLEIGLGLIAPLVVAAVVGGVAAFAAHLLCARILATDVRPIVLTLAVAGIGGVILVGLSLDLPVIPHMGFVALATFVGAAAILGTALHTDGHRPVLWVVFVSFLLVGAAVAFARTADTPKLEPVAVLLEKPNDQIGGFYVGESDDRIHIAPLRHGSGLVEVSAEPVESVVSVSRERVLRMAMRSPAGLGLADEGREQAERLLEDLIVEQRASAGEAPPAAEPVETADPASTFAPLVSLHSREPVSPTSADYFLEGSRLLWSFRGCDAKLLARRLDKSEDWGRLGGGGFRQASRCGDRGAVFGSADFTRPYAKKRPGLSGREGFFLDLANRRRRPKLRTEARGSQQVLSNVPVYFERHPVRVEPGQEQRITYWFFYPFSISPGGSDKISHEGDWERVSVLLRKGQATREWTPVAVRYHEHDTHVDVPWADVRKAPDDSGRATHPRAYVAKGSHATYRRSGKHVQVLARRGLEVIRVVDDARACPQCPLWFTWQRVIDAQAQPWYGFGGAWGKVGDASDFTGPLGPSGYKTLGLSAAPETSLQQASEGAAPVPPAVTPSSGG